MKVFLVHADDGPGTVGRLDTAAALARATGGHVTVLVNTPFQNFVAMDPFGGAYLATEAFAEAKARDAALVAQLGNRLAEADVPHDLLSAQTDALTALVQASSLADLVVAGLIDADSPRYDARPMLAGDLALASGGPVLANPEGAGALDPNGPAIVAWNGRAEAAAALRAALPLLAGRAVTLLRIGAEVGPIPDSAAIDYCARHAVAATMQVEQDREGSTGQVIQRQALEMRAGLVVMGAFGHSRLRETLFGGVTQHLLTTARVPLLLAH